jgi:hypothetical protein
VLLHHDDIQDFLQVLFLCIRSDPLLTLVQGDEEELTRLLAESGVAERVEVDENGGRSRSCIANSQVLTFDSWTTPQPCSNWTLKAGLTFASRSTVAAKDQQPEGLGGNLSSLNAAIETLKLAEDTSGIAPAKAAFGSASVLLTEIRVCSLLLQ